MPLPVPAYIKNEKHPAAQHRFWTRYLVRVCALLHNKNGSVPGLAEAVGMNVRQFQAKAHYGDVDLDLARKIVAVVGHPDITETSFTTVEL